MKNNNKVSGKIIKYIKDNNISVVQIEKDTGIEQEKLADENVQFSASEFLEICSYLNLKPEDIM